MTNDNVTVTSNVRDAVILMLPGDAEGKEKGGRRKCYTCTCVCVGGGKGVSRWMCARLEEKVTSSSELDDC